MITHFCREEIEAQVRDKMQTETERKVRLALVQQMRPQVRAELEQALRLEIQTAFREEIRKEVEAALIPELEKRITMELKAKYSKSHAIQKEQAESALQAELASLKKELEERMRREAESKVARKMAKQLEAEVRVRTEKVRQEMQIGSETQAKAIVEAEYKSIKEERAEIARQRAAENVRRTREDAALREAQHAFQVKVAEFRRYVQYEEARLARSKAAVQWHEEHPKLSSSTPVPSSAPDHVELDATPDTPVVPVSTALPMLSPAPIPPLVSHLLNTSLDKSSSQMHPPVHIPGGPFVKPLKTPSINASSPISHDGTTSNVPSTGLSKAAEKPTGVAFDFTFDVKLIAAKLVSDVCNIRKHSDVVTYPPSQSPTAPLIPLPYTTSMHTDSTGQIATEQQAQRDFETQPPIIPPAGVLGTRIRLLLPRLYQLWDQCETSHLHRRDFSNSLRSLDIVQAERLVAMEIAQLRKNLPNIQQEMTLVARREAIKARLAQLEDKDGNVLHAAEKASLQAELRRLTSSVHAALTVWESSHGRPFTYRGFPYLALMSTPT